MTTGLSTWAFRLQRLWLQAAIGFSTGLLRPVDNGWTTPRNSLNEGALTRSAALDCAPPGRERSMWITEREAR